MLRLDITADLIAYGEPNSIETCPIAMALVLQGFTRVRVGRGAAAWDDNEGRRWRAKLPREARAFVSDFDDREDVEPLTVTLAPVVLRDAARAAWEGS